MHEEIVDLRRRKFAELSFLGERVIKCLLLIACSMASGPIVLFNY